MSGRFIDQQCEKSRSLNGAPLEPPGLFWRATLCRPQRISKWAIGAASLTDQLHPKFGFQTHIQLVSSWNFPLNDSSWIIQLTQNTKQAPNDFCSFLIGGFYLFGCARVGLQISETTNQHHSSVSFNSLLSQKSDSTITWAVEEIRRGEIQKRNFKIERLR